MKNIIIFGSGGHSKVVIDIIENYDQFRILGLIDSYREKDCKVNGYRILGDECFIKENSKDIDGGIVAIGDNYTRSQVVSRITKICPSFNFISAIHPNAIIGKGVNIGEGSVIMAGSVINSDSSIGKHCIINTKSSIDHDAVIGDFVTTAPGVTLGGNVKIGNFSAISLGANIIHKKNIGEHTVIGAGSTVISNIDSYVVAYGTPARIIRKRKMGEKYL